ncbi:hypothetical protein VTL71DRAFT_2964 [Oculimacula yallundae]|uniref:Uncharacterized protein n=1 Tax=Oculimacula yallundae TaxID=86028 RepID=A0ABR4C5S6_9HELO
MHCQWDIYEAVDEISCPKGREIKETGWCWLRDFCTDTSCQFCDGLRDHFKGIDEDGKPREVYLIWSRGYQSTIYDIKSMQVSDHLPQFPIEDLPRDLWHYILKFMLVSDETITNPYLQHQKWYKTDPEADEETEGGIINYSWSKYLRPSILATNKFYHFMGTKFLYRYNTFRFTRLVAQTGHLWADFCTRSKKHKAVDLIDKFLEFEHCLMDTPGEDTPEEDSLEEDTSEEGTSREDSPKEDRSEGGTPREGTPEEDTSEEDTLTLREDTPQDQATQSEVEQPTKVSRSYLLRKVVVEDSDLDSDYYAKRGISKMKPLVCSKDRYRYLFYIFNKFVRFGGDLSDLTITIDEEEPGVLDQIDFEEHLISPKQSSQQQEEREAWKNTFLMKSRKAVTTKWKFITTSERAKPLTIKHIYIRGTDAVAGGILSFEHPQSWRETLGGIRVSGNYFATSRVARSMLRYFEGRHVAGWLKNSPIVSFSGKFSQRRLKSDGTFVPDDELEAWTANEEDEARGV